MKSAAKYSAALNACLEELNNFSATGVLEATETGRFTPYLLNGVQVGSVKLLLYIAQRLYEENAVVQSENVRLEEELRQKEEELSELQKIVDESISNL